MSASRRCTECRKTFTPARSASSTQRVCGAACRVKRDRSFARSRRLLDLEGSRAEERARQQTRRDALARLGCHAPASRRKCPLSSEEVGRIVDRVLGRSRATLVRDVRGILLRFASISGEPPAPPGPMSRASLGAQEVDNSDEFGESLASPSRMSLGDRRSP
jgi:hypothetical protein